MKKSLDFNGIDWWDARADEFMETNKELVDMVYSKYPFYLVTFNVNDNMTNPLKIMIRIRTSSSHNDWDIKNIEVHIKNNDQAFLIFPHSVKLSKELEKQILSSLHELYALNERFPLYPGNEFH